MITELEFYGDGEETTTGATKTLKPKSNRVQSIDPSANIDVVLPDARVVYLGGPHFYIIHVGAGNNMTLKDADGNALATIAVDEGVTVGLARGDSLAGKWMVRLSALGEP